MGAVIGIDLGTTNTVVAAVRDGRAVALPDESGSTLIPSIVSFLPSGAVLVGSAARERRSDDVRNTIYSVKRLIGRTWDSPEVGQAQSRFPFELREGPGRATFVIARGETYTLPEISAFVLRKAKSIAELELGESVDRAVITVPANFNDLQRAATKVAGRVAGLEILRIINEPTAAALAFGHTLGEPKLLAVYDFGGGTFDFTVLRLTEEVFEVLTTAGNTFLGGDDIDAEIVERMADRFVAEDQPDPRETPEGLERLRFAAEQLKVILSTEPDASVRLDELGIVDCPSVEFLLTRRDLDSITRPVIEKTFVVCQDALTAAKVSVKEIDDVLLVGGSTKDPYVRKRVREFFGKPARHDIDPHEVVALGAAQQAALLTRTNAAADAVPPPPLPRPALSSSTDEAQNGEFRQKTQPFGRVAPFNTGTTDFAFPSEELPNTTPLASTAEVPSPARVSIVPPEGPLSQPTPATRDIARRDRRTTGVGLGPNEAPGPEVLPLVGLGVHSPVLPKPQTPIPLDAQPPSTLSGIGPKARVAVDSKERFDAELPVVKPGDPREFGRGPTVRVASGTAVPTRAGLDLSQTLTSALVRPDLPNAPDFSKQIVPATRGGSPRSPSTDPFGSALVNPTREPAAPGVAATATTDLPATVIQRAPLAQPSVLTESKPTPPGASASTFGVPQIGEIQAPLLAEPGDDEPTVARRSNPELGSASLSSDSQPELPELSSSAPHPTNHRERPSSLNEDEIRARYGNLPLIVGGKRVGTPATTARDAPHLPTTTVGTVALPSVPNATTNPAHPATAATLPRQLTQVVAPTQLTSANAKPLSLEPEPIESEFEPFELEESEPPSSRPEPGRFQSSRPAQRQDSALEAALPLPNLPPTANQGTHAPDRSFQTGRHPPPPHLDIATVAVTAGGSRSAAIAFDSPPNATRSPVQPGITRPPEVPPNLPPPRNPSTGPLDRSFPISPAAVPVTEAEAFPFAPPQRTASMPTVQQPTASPSSAAPAARAVEKPTTLAPRSSPSRRPPGPALLIDVTPLSLCVETAGGYSDVLVTRNTPVPCERTRDFVTIHDNQEMVVVRVAQGESQQFQENVLLGEVQLSKITRGVRGQTRISVTFGLDSDGMLHVRAIDVATGQSAIAELQLTAAPSSPELRQMISRHKTKGSVAGSN